MLLQQHEVVTDLVLECAGATVAARLLRTSKGGALCAGRAAAWCLGCDLEAADGDEAIEDAALRACARVDAWGHAELAAAPGVAADVSAHCVVGDGAGGAVACGRGRDGQRGVRSVMETSTTLAPVDFGRFRDPVAKVSCGFDHTLFVLGAGLAFGCGSSKAGQLGSAAAPCRSCSIARPIPELAATRVADCGAGDRFSLFVVGDDRRVVGLGRNDDGCLGIGTYDPPKALPRFLARPATALGLNGVTSLAAGWNHALAVSDGRLYAWGAGSRGQCGMRGRRSGPAPARVVDGSVGDVVVVAAAAGDAMSLALDDDGGVHGCGDARSGALGLGPRAVVRKHVVLFERLDVPEPVASFAVGCAHAIAAARSGRLYTWGGIYSGHLDATGRGGPYEPRLIPCVADVVAVAAGGSREPYASASLACLRNGAVLVAGGSRYLPEDAPVAFWRSLEPIASLELRPVELPPGVRAGDYERLAQARTRSGWAELRPPRGADAAPRPSLARRRKKPASAYFAGVF